MGTAVNVQVFSRGQAAGVHQFNSDTQRTIRIGRMSSAQLKLEDPKAAKIHAVIDFSGGNVALIDMTNGGTLVNGAKVHKVALNDGDEVKIGDTQLVIGFGNGVAAPAVAAAANEVTAVSAAPQNVQPQTPAPSAAAPQVAAAASVAVQAPNAEAAPAGAMPRFDGPQTAPMERIAQARLRSAAVESRPHPSLPPEDSLRPDSRALEMRVYWGQLL